MSDAIIVRRGSTGGMSPSAAVVHVSAPAGSTITFVKSGITVKTLGPEKGHIKITDSNYADWYWNIVPANYGSWTITATVGNISLTETLMVNTNKHYDVLLFIGELYNHGNEYAGVTGGWVVTTALWQNAGSTTFAYKDPYIARGNDTIWAGVNQSGYSNGKGFALSTANKIDLTRFSTLKVNTLQAGHGASGSFMRLSVTPVNTGNIRDKEVASVDLPTKSTQTEYSISVAAIEGEYYILFTGGSYSNQNAFVEFDRVWLE